MSKEEQKKEIREKLGNLIENTKILDIIKRDRYTLDVCEGVKSGSLFYRRNRFKIIKGDCITLRYGTTSDEWGSIDFFLLFPLELGTIVKTEETMQQRNEAYEQISYFIFTANGWTEVVIE